MPGTSKIMETWKFIMIIEYEVSQLECCSIKASLVLLGSVLEIFKFSLQQSKKKSNPATYKIWKDQAEFVPGM